MHRGRKADIDWDMIVRDHKSDGPMKSCDIVLAEDHISVREGIKRIIEEDPSFRIIAEAGDGWELMEVFYFFQPHLVIMDVTMPNLSGIEATRRIKQNYPKTKVLILTLHQDKDIMKYAFKAGADGYLVKEDAKEELLPAIHSVMNSGRPYICTRMIAHFGEYYIRNLNRGLVKPKIPPPAELTAREFEILKLIAEGKSSKEIGYLLCLSSRTIHHHRSNIRRKLNLHKNSDLIKYALLRGFAK
jgi:DNA-binding NarL/FixJ family response regulator